MNQKLILVISKDTCLVLNQGTYVSFPFEEIEIVDQRGSAAGMFPAVKPMEFKPVERKPMNYPSLYSAQRSALNNAWAQAQHPRIAEIMLISSTADSSDRVIKLIEQCVVDGIPVDEELVRGRGDVDRVMATRVATHTKYIVGFRLPDIEENRIRPQSTNPADFKPFDLQAHIAAGGKAPRQLWIMDPTGAGPQFAPGIDATAYPGKVAMGLAPTGDPRQNPNQLTEYVSDTPGQNGAIARTDSVYGFLVPSGEQVGPGETESQWVAKMEGRAWWFERYDKVA